MIVQCEKCNLWYDDEFRLCVCPHRAFPANDGHNNFAVRENAWLSSLPPDAPTPEGGLV